MVKTFFFFFIIGILFSGCSIKREIKPVDKVVDEKICIIENDAVKKGFLVAYKEGLEELGYKVKVLPSNSDKNMCKVSSVYTARWSWDLAIYMSYAKIDVYENSTLLGSALYDSTYGGGRIFEKFGNAANMVKSLVKELYPNKIIQK